MLAEAVMGAVSASEPSTTLSAEREMLSFDRSLPVTAGSLPPLMLMPTLRLLALTLLIVKLSDPVSAVRPVPARAPGPVQLRSRPLMVELSTLLSQIAVPAVPTPLEPSARTTDDPVERPIVTPVMFDSRTAIDGLTNVLLFTAPADRAVTVSRYRAALLVEVAPIRVLPCMMGL